MIRYSLKCDQDHAFESWFNSAESFASLRDQGHVACVICGSTRVEKALMAPAVRPARKAATSPATKDEPQPLGEPTSEVEKALRAMRHDVEQNSDYVGLNFAAEARAMHEGETLQRPIHGEAKPDEARKLLEDGVPVLPLPFIPKRQTN